MSVEHIVVSVVLLLLLALVARPLSGWSRLPYPGMLVLLGFLGSELVTMAGIDTGLRADNFHQLVFYVFIPLLVFDSAYRIDLQVLKRIIVPVLFLAIFGIALTFSLIAAGLYYGIGHPSGFPWAAALLAGAILAATDPVAVVSQLRETGAPARLSVLLEGESLFNDATAIVLFTIVLGIATASSATVQTAPDILLAFLKVFLGGLTVGIASGFLAELLARRYEDERFAGLLSIVLAYGSYLLAERLHLSGVMATLMAAITYAVLQNRHLERWQREKRHYLWSSLAHVAEVILFIVMGVTVTLSMFEERWLAMLIAIGAVLAARAISVYGGLSLLGLFQKEPFETRSQTLIIWGGLRGAVALALVLSLPTELDYWWTVQSAVFGVVLFTLFVQAPTIQALARSLGIRR